ncbi:MAG: helix-turn-helix domain-containing protein, partial [Phycisphaerae bacterium]
RGPRCVKRESVGAACRRGSRLRRTVRRCPARGGQCLHRRALGIDEQSAAAVNPAGMPRRPIPVSHIVDHVCQALAVDPTEFAGKGRHKRVVFARSVAAVLARQLTTQSFPEIARAMGRGNHSTIITAQRRLQRELESKPHQLLESDVAPMHPGLTLSELLTTIAKAIRQSAR